jgi:undecaprenyl-diphosphatase
LLITEHWLGARSEVFNVVIQSGAMVGLTAIYWRQIWAISSGWQSDEALGYALKLACSFIVTVALGLPAKKLGFELPRTLAPVAWALILGGAWIIAAELIAARRSRSADITWTIAVAVGAAQIVAGVFPGTSRSGATIFTAMVLGASDRSAATQFSFLVGLPTMYAASAYELYSASGSGAGAENWGELGSRLIKSTKR